MITLLSDSGMELATGALRPGRADRTLEFDRIVRGKGHLLHYFFGRGKRAVIVESGEFRLRGILGTRWLGQERLWKVSLEEPRPVRTIVAAADRTSTAPAAAELTRPRSDELY